MADDGLKRIKLSEDYAGQKAGSIYVCDPVRAQWLLENDHGREATAADLRPKSRSAPEGGYQPSDGPKRPVPAGEASTGTERPKRRRKR